MIKVPISTIQEGDILHMHDDNWFTTGNDPICIHESTHSAMRCVVVSVDDEDIHNTRHAHARCVCCNSEICLNYRKLDDFVFVLNAKEKILLEMKQ
jgi:hypothetical protein